VGVVTVLAWRALRRHVTALVAVAAVVAVGVGAALASAEIADRTERSYVDYLRRAEVADLVVNPTLDTTRTRLLFESTPGVRVVTTDSMLTATADDGAPRPQLAVEAGFLQVRMSPDGRYVEQDRPVVRAGRLPRSGAEAFVNEEAADELDVDMGDTMPLAFWEASFSGPGSRPDPGPVEPLGRVRVRVVGVGTFADEVLPDRLFPRPRVLVTPEVGEPYSCTIANPVPNDTRTLEELGAALIPDGCAVGGTFYSLRLVGGRDSAPAVADALARRFREENERLPVAMRNADVGYFLAPAFTADDVEQVRQSLSPVVTSLRAFAIAAGLTTIAVALLLIVRHVRGRDVEVAIWRSIGMSRTQRGVAVILPAVAAVVAGFVGALLVAYTTSPLGPLASARTVDPHPSPGLSSAIALPAVGALVAALVGVALVAAGATGRSVDTSIDGVAQRPFVPPGRPALALGVRAAVAGRGAVALLGGAVMAVGAVVATLVFSTSVIGLVETPARFGWSFDAAVLVNGGFGGIDIDAVASSLDRPGVDGWGVGAVTGGLSVNGVTLPFLASRIGLDDLVASTMSSGDPPRRDDEIAIGARTARALDLDVGDRVHVVTAYGERRATISGLAVLPHIGQLETDPTSLGTGVLVPSAFFEAIVTGAEADIGMPADEIADSLGSFVAIDLADGVDAAEFVDDLEDDLATWDPSGITPLTFSAPVRPPTVVDLADTREVPLLLAGVLAVALVASVVAGVAAGTRARGGELAVFRALGGTPRQLRASVRSHAVTVVAVALGFGLPIGIALGRVSFLAFIRDLGAAPIIDVPLLPIAALAGAVVVVGLVAAVVPAHRAARPARTLEVLREGSDVRPVTR
jgi:hypothetical protein